MKRIYTDEPTNQPINQSTNQPINQSTNQPIKIIKPLR
ncbi:PT domain-containing protein [Haemophilus influenzae]